MKTRTPVLSLLAIACLLIARDAGGVFAGQWFVAPNGADGNPGTREKPFATVMQAQKAVSPGDTVYLRGGTYSMQPSQIAKQERIYAQVIHLDKSGTADQPIRYWAYQDEHPVFDFAAIKPAGLRVNAFNVPASWLHFKGIEVIGVQVTIKTHTQSICFANDGSHNIYEQLKMHDGQAIGIYSVRGSDNVFLNCDAYRNFDFTSEDGRGGNVDGFGCHPPRGGTGNVFRGCRAWFNSDDGYDCINAHESVTFENCWAMDNGYSTKFKSLGDGNGFKAGGYGSSPISKLPSVIPRHSVKFCLAVHNKANGFYANHHIGGDDWFNNTAFRNGRNFNMLCRLKDNVTDVPGYDHLLLNNLGYRGGSEIANMDSAKCEAKHNSFALDLKPGDNDFVSLDEAQLIGPRQANGDLPNISFMHLAAGSQWIGKGQPGEGKSAASKPYLGAFAE